MDEKISWQDFCSQYYEQTMKSAKYHLDRYNKTARYWDKRIDEEAIMIDATMTALEKAYAKYDPSRGSGYGTLLENIVGHEIVNELRRVPKYVTSMDELNDGQEMDATFRNMASLIPEDDMEMLKEKLRGAILKLSSIDQCILSLYLNNPKTFIEESVEELHIPASVVSVRKCRALTKLPSLMGVSSSEYFDMFEERPTIGMIQNKLSNVIVANPVYPQFDLDGTVNLLYEAILNSTK